MRRRTGPVVAMADGALIQIERAPTRPLAGVFRQGAGPRHVVGVDVKHCGFRVHGGTAPFRAAVKAGKYHGWLSHAQRNKLPCTAELRELFDRPLMGLGSAVGQHVCGETLARERRRLGGKRLGGCGLLPRHRARWVAAVVDGEKRLAIPAVEQVDKSRLGGLGDGVDRASVAGDGDQTRRRGKISVPHIVLHRLKMPDAAAGSGIQRDQGIGKQVVAHPVGAIEIRRRRPGRHVDDPTVLIERHAGPIVGRAAVRPGAFRPGLITELSGMRNRVEGPAELSGLGVVGANIARRGRQSLRLACAEYHQILVNHAGAGGDDGLGLEIASQIFAEVDASVLAKFANGFSGAGVESIDEICDAGENALIIAT